MKQKFRFECARCDAQCVREEPPEDEPCIFCGHDEWIIMGKAPDRIMNAGAFLLAMFLIASAAVVAASGFALYLLGIPLTDRSLTGASLIINGAGIIVYGVARGWLEWQRFMDRREIKAMRGGDDAPF